ncbi:PDR/VanB family oxidoreductase [Bradyrhizobium sp. 186]|uniref:PDR/VanB family oxidoreductase n=1 Tax=Bradyrhizobium sp. 186 TaxID=2782654 RepID=UPI002000866D|nr:PDR/VanB family oxidoreductase [Bradyrhizobium sp. 186]UPK38248.1 PDR/VanB family oxidoreductase [Bradyrhizobium sp. 186]
MDRATALVASVEEVAADVKAFRLVLEDEKNIPFEPGGHLDVEVLVGGQVQTRSYSMFRLDDEPGFAIAVKHAPHGHGGSAYMWSQKAGARLGVRRARNSLPMDYSANRYLLIAAGIGVTPIIAAARALHEAGKSVGMHYCVRRTSGAPFIAELERLLGGAIIVHASAGGQRTQADRLIEQVDSNTICYVCGPIGFMDELIHAWHRRGLPKHHLRFETFGSSGRLPTGKFEVVVRETGARVLVPEEMSMLDALIVAKQEVMYGCRRGECGLCKVEVDELDGEIDHRDVFLSDQERALNRAICCCVSRVRGHSIVIRADGISHGRPKHGLGRS